MFAKTFKVTGWQELDLPIAARVMGEDGAPYQPSHVSEISYKVFNQAGAETDSGTFSVNSSLFDELQMDDRWKEDSLGFNFFAIFPAVGFETPGTHRIEVFFEVNGGRPTAAICIQAEMLPLRSFS